MLEEAIAHQGERRVVSGQTQPDGRNRPQQLQVRVPEPLPPPDGLEPSGRLPAAPSFPMIWDPVPGAREYRVQLRLEDETEVLRFVTGDVPVLTLDSGAVTAAAQSPALGPTARQVYLDALDPDPDHLLRHGPDDRYQWRVQAIRDDLEPTPWSEWIDLSDACQIVDFAVEPGSNGPPLVQWRTYNCEGPRYSVQVLATTGDLADNGCELGDGLFSALDQGPRPAHFVYYGYNYHDVCWAHPGCGDGPVWDPTFNGPLDCAPPGPTEFRMVVVDVQSGEIVDERAPLVSSVVNDPNACEIEKLLVFQGWDQQPPRVVWQTARCAAYTTVIKATTAIEATPLRCRLDREIVWTGAAG
ncbi:MAG: hypothetical protein MI919_02280, partial [Holophagales bacterium]|nr:hypothetical protein [Holophagales bacterium]